MYLIKGDLKAVVLYFVVLGEAARSAAEPSWEDGEVNGLRLVRNELDFITISSGDVTTGKYSAVGCSRRGTMLKGPVCI